MSFVVVSSVINFTMHLAYDTVYYYFLPFAPIFLVFYSRLQDVNTNVIKV